jgi:hypothetical protein
MAMQDVLAEFDTLLLPDSRLVDRVRSVVERAWGNPSATLPQMLQDTAQLEGAYRLLNNRRVDFEALLAPHAECASKRAEKAEVVVVAHDTTEVETAFAEPSEVGYLKTGRTGYLAHVSLAMGFERDRPPRPYGVLSVIANFQPNSPQYDGKRKSKSGWQTARSTDKAFLRWEQGIEASSRSLKGSSTVIHVADREADSYPLMHKVIQLGDGCVFRIRCDRRARIVDDEDFADDWSSLSEIASAMEGSFECTVPLSKRGDKAAPATKKRHPPREARGARLQYSATQVELRRPHYQPAALPASLHLWLVRVWEPEPPADEVGVEWLLLTTEPCTTPAEIMHVVDLYRSRWVIEDYFKTLKSVCKVQERQFETKHALLNLLALFVPIAVHLLWIRACARDTPDAPATDVFTPVQLEVLTHLASRKMPANPTAVQATWVLAGFGGHIANNGWPGPQVLARAFCRLVEATSTWQAALLATQKM